MPCVENAVKCENNTLYSCVNGSWVGFASGVCPTHQARYVLAPEIYRLLMDNGDARLEFENRVLTELRRSNSGVGLGFNPLVFYGDGKTVGLNLSYSSGGNLGGSGRLDLLGDIVSLVSAIAGIILIIAGLFLGPAVVIGLVAAGVVLVVFGGLVKVATNVVEVAATQASMQRTLAQVLNDPSVPDDVKRSIAESLAKSGVGGNIFGDIGNIALILFLGVAGVLFLKEVLPMLSKK